MKFTLTLTVVALLACLSSSVTGSPQRQKRAVARENCPEKATREECLAFAAEKSKGMKNCHRFVVGDKTIEWQSCGVVSCGDNGKLVKEDLSKPYPDCCRRCEAVDDSKPAVFSAVL